MYEVKRQVKKIQAPNGITYSASVYICPICKYENIGIEDESDVEFVEKPFCEHFDHLLADEGIAYFKESK